MSAVDSSAPLPKALLWLAALAACCAPSLLAYNVSPSPTFLNQALAFALWGGFMIVAAGGVPTLRPAVRDAAPLLLALALLMLAALGSWTPGHLPAGLALSALGTLAAALLVAVHGAAVRGRRDGLEVFVAFCGGLACAGLLNIAIAMVQVFAPDWPDGEWIARSGYAGRAVGNLRQPNHLSSLLLWSAIAWVALLELRRVPRRVVVAAFALTIFAVVLSASRTGLVSVGMLALWGLVDRRLARPTRLLLLAAPLVYAVSWAGLAAWAESTAQTFGAEARLAESDVSGSRFAIWSNTFELIRQQPWLGVGFGEFNLAWTLTPFPGRPVAFFDHAHNLELQLAAELGVPLAAAVVGCLLWALWRVWRRDAGAGPDDTVAQRCALLVALMIGLHSQLEYPLWYAYFLLPAAWAWGYGLGTPSTRAASRGGREGSVRLALAGVAMVVGAAASLHDYLSVVVIFEPPREPTPLDERIQRGRASVLFAHHADYAAATDDAPPADAGAALRRAVHYLLDARLMIAWANALAADGETDKARHLAQRLKEFRNPGAEAYFEPCTVEPRLEALPYQCLPPPRQVGWREFVR